MAIEYDIAGLLNKTENEGSTEAGRLTAKEWNHLVGAVGEVQTKVEGTIKGIKYNETQIFDQIDEQGYLTMSVADTSGYDFWIHATNPPAIIARGSECPVSVSVTNKVFQQDGTKIPNTAAALVNIYINDILVNSGQVYDISFGDRDSAYYDPSKSTVYTFDLSTAKATSLVVGTVNTVKIECNNRSGVIKDYNCDVEVIELSLVVNSFGEVNVFTESKKPNIIATVSGNDANINAKVDGTTIVSNYAVKAGESNNIGESKFESVNTHGVHELEIWAAVTRTIGGQDYVISTQPQKFTYIYGTSSTQPIVMSNISNTKPEEYSTLNIDYIAYKYNNTAAAVKDTVSVVLCEHLGYDAQGKPIPGNELGTPVTSDVTFDVTTNSGSGTAGISLFPVTVGNNSVSLVGKRLVKISVGDFSQYTEIEVMKSSVTLTQLGGYAVYLTSAGRNNTQANKREWISTGKDKKGGQLVVNTEFPADIEFLDTGSGWLPDSDGNVAMHLKRGKHFTLDYQPFTDNPTYDDGTNGGTGLGKTISFEIATRNCLKNDSPVISCLDSSNGAERGFVITASQAILKSNNFGLQAKFRENVRIKVDFVIEGIKNAYTYTTIAGKDATENDWEKDKVSREALCIIYVDGVYQALKVIPDGTNFLQGRTGTPAPKITFGSDDCDLDIYNIRIYDQALTPAQIVNNYAYDTPKYEEKLAIAARNDIFDNTSLGNKPNINIEKLRRARPVLPFWYAKMEIDPATGKDVTLPYDKTNWKNQTHTEWKNPANETDKFGGAISFTTDAGKLRNQGTSSMTYPWPWRNWDWKIDKKQGSGKFTLGDGSKESAWCQYQGMNDTENLKKITLKKDYASSEMCNNAITSEMYTDMALGIGGNPGFENVLSPAQRALGALTPYRLTFKAIPCFMFQEFNDPNQQGTAGKGYEALGMMNLIANKNECGHLGFMGDYVWDPEDGKRSQSWELADNMDDWFWYKKITPIHVDNVTGADGKPTTKIINECLECYEARYPKDSTLNEKLWNGEKDEADFGGTPKGYITITQEQKEAIEDEQYDIIEFHNWLVDCNRQIPEDYYNGLADYDEVTKDYVPVENTGAAVPRNEYRKLTGDEENAPYNIDSSTGAPLHTHDTPDYRLNRFIKEAPTRLIVDQFCLYYIWRETFHAFDSGFKNLQVYTMGKANEDCAYQQWGCMVRDADTTLGIENTGKDIFPPHLEDIDYYTADEDASGNAVSNVKFVYGGANGMYHASSIDKLSGHPILNGQLGSLWINLRDGFRSRIAVIYGELKGSTKTNWNASAAIKRFRDHQEKWCENLYNFGMRQYFGGAPFTKWIESGLGDKKNSRASWLERGFYYRDSKYQALSDVCTVRAVTYESPDEGINGSTANTPLKMKAYIPMYFLSGATTEDPTTCTVSIRVTDTDNTFDVLPGPGGLALATTGDQNRWFWGSSMLTEVGDFARVCKVKMFQKLDLPKVRDFSLGHEKDRDGKTYMEYYYETTGEGDNIVSTKKQREFQNEFLESIAVDSLKQMSVFDITNHKALNLITGLEECKQLSEFYARGTDSLRALTLPATTSLKKIYLGKSLVQLNLVDLTNIEKFELEGVDNIEKVYIRNCGPYMAERSYDIALQTISALENAYDPDYNKNVCAFTGVNWQSCTSSMVERLVNINAQLEGTINLSDSLKNDLKVKLVKAYGDIDDPNNGLYITYNQVAITDISMPNKIYIHKPGETALSFTSNPVTANTYSRAEWTLSGAGDYATINPETGVITRTTKEATEATPAAQLKVKVYQIPDKRGVARPAVESNTVSVYFYERHAKPGDIVYHDGTFTDEIDNTKTPIGVCFYVDPDDKQNRLMVALENIYQGNADNGYEWGVGTGGYYSTTDGLEYYGSPQIDATELGLTTMMDIIDIKSIPNVVEHGGDPTLEQMLDDENYRDNGASRNDYFKQFEFQSMMGNMGWDVAKYDVSIDYQKVIEAGKSYPVSYIYTMAVIEKRNFVMDFFPDLVITGTSGRTSELSNLFTDFANAKKVQVGEWKTGAHTYMFPAASLVYAYEPGGEGNIEGLLDKFKKRNWFIPASGDVCRISYYMRQYYLEDPSVYDGANAFKTAIDAGKLKTAGFLTSLTGGKTILSSTEYGVDAAKFVCVNSNGISTNSSYTEGVTQYTGICGGSQKYDTARIRPICRF